MKLILYSFRVPSEHQVISLSAREARKSPYMPRNLYTYMISLTTDDRFVPIHIGGTRKRGRRGDNGGTMDGETGDDGETGTTGGGGNGGRQGWGGDDGEMGERWRPYTLFIEDITLISLRRCDMDVFCNVNHGDVNLIFARAVTQ